MKPGIKTTELLISLIALVLVNLPAVLVDSEWVMIAAMVGNVLVAGGYTMFRTQLKVAETSVAVRDIKVVNVDSR